MYALAQQSNICFEKMVFKLGIVIAVMAIFSGGGMKLNATESVLGYYVQENTMLKEQSNALFLLRQAWMNDVKEKYAQYQVREIADGIVYVRMIKTINAKKVKINIAEINRNVNSNIEIAPKLASVKLHARKKIKNIAPDAKIAVNGTYFKQDTGTPLGALVIDNKIITGPIYERVALGIGENGFKTSRAAFEGYIKTGDKIIKIDNINQPRMLFTQTLMYTPIWGEMSPASKKQSINIAVSNGKIIKISSSPVAIPKDGYVISSASTMLKSLKKGDSITVKYTLKPEWKDIEHVISGGPYLIKDGNIFIDTASQKLNGITGRNPRTAVGYTKDNVMIMVTVDGRKENVSGVTLGELAEILKELGCYEAINLDGGSSTVMYVDGSTINGSNLNSVAVSNALTVSIRG